VNSLAGLVERNKRQVRRRHMVQRLVGDILDHRLHADLHGGVKRAIHTRLQDEHVPNMYRRDKVDVVHRNGDRNPASMARSRQRGDQVNKLQQPAAKQIAERVGIAREDDLGALRLGIGHGARMGHIRHIPIVTSSRISAKYDGSMDKIAMLTEILEANPADAFARYGLAMAYAAEGRSDDALREFAETTKHTPDYVPAYQMSAQELLKLGRSDEARERLQAGLAACDRTSNTHAASEMGAMLDELS
jgi:tetratricopeptide (TPR) repeat protein